MGTNYRYQPVLKHHGILGMKWGVRRFRNKNGSLTALGKIHERDKDNIKRAEDNLNRIKRHKSQRLSYKGVQVDNARQQLKDAKLVSKMHTHNKSKRQQKLEQKYLDKGMTPQEAELAAYKRVRTERILAGVGALTLTAAAAYVANKHFKENVDKYIDPSIKLKRVSMNDSMDVHDAFYASYKKGDTDKYIGLYGRQIRLLEDQQPHLKTISQKGLKIAGNKTGRRTLEEMIKNDEGLKSKIKRDIFNDPAFDGGNKYEKAVREINRGKISKKVYDDFNRRLVEKSSVSKDFYEALKKKGYSGVLDVNDMKYSGYNAKAPIIVFDKSKVSVDKVRELTNRNVNDMVDKIVRREAGSNLAKRGAAILGTNAMLGVTSYKVTRAVSNKSAVKRYKKEHPGTKLTNQEIIDQIVKGNT